jgi:hypothetical protein
MQWSALQIDGLGGYGIRFISDFNNRGYFVGLTIPDAAAILDVYPRTADAWWSYARGWLAEELKK